jgi:hypothetical protein
MDSIGDLFEFGERKISTSATWFSIGKREGGFVGNPHGATWQAVKPDGGRSGARVAHSPLIMPASISSRLKRRASAPSAHR